MVMHSFEYVLRCMYRVHCTLKNRIEKWIHFMQMPVAWNEFYDNYFIYLIRIIYLSLARIQRYPLKTKDKPPKKEKQKT
jgi:hypothetical protein